MSYILEALKRAEAERDRGAVPTLHSQPQASPTSVTAPRGSVPWVGILSGLLLLTVGALAALWWRGSAPATAQAPVVATPSAPLPTPPAPAPVAAAPAPAPVAPPVRPKPAPPAAPATPAPAAPTQAAVAPPAPAAPAAPATTKQTPAPAPAAQNSRVYAMAELPADMRQQLPKLAVSGASYSEQSAYRMLIVNGQVFHEQDEITNGLVLETIGPKSAVLRFQGMRFSLGY